MEQRGFVNQSGVEVFDSDRTRCQQRVQVGRRQGRGGRHPRAASRAPYFDEMAFA